MQRQLSPACPSDERQVWGSLVGTTKNSLGSISAGQEAAWDGHQTLKWVVTYAWNLQSNRPRIPHAG